MDRQHAGWSAAAIRRASEPLWLGIEQDLRRRLQTEEFAAAFPGELALARYYGVSRSTVRQALRELRSAGLVLGQRGRQPRVAPTVEIEQPMGALYSLFATVEAAGIEQRSHVRTLAVRADAVVATRLRLEGSTPLVYLERLRLAGGEPLAVDRVWLPAQVAEPLLDADFTHTGLYDELAGRCGIRLTEGHERLRAVVPTSSERRLLHTDETTAAFAIERLGSRNDCPLEWRHTLVRGDRFGVAAVFSGRGGYQFGVTTGH